MASVTFDPAIGGDGSTVTDDNDPSTGLKAGGHRLRFVPALAQLVAVSAYMVSMFTTNMAAMAASLASAAAYAASALGAPGTMATCATGIAISAGTKNFTLTQTGKLYSLGQVLIFASRANPANYVTGRIASFVSGTGVGTLTVVAGGFGGSGTPTDWDVSLGANAGVNSVAGLAGDVSSAALKTALAVTVADVTDYAADQAAKAKRLTGLSMML